MADKALEQLQADYADITEKNRLAYEALYSDPSGWAGHEDNSVNAHYENAVKNGKLSPELKAQYEKLSAAYKKTQEAKNELKKKIDAYKKSSSEKKLSDAKSKSAQNVYDKAIADLKIAEAKLGSYGGEKEYIDAYNKAKAASDTLAKAGGKPQILEPKITIPATSTGLQTGDKNVSTDKGMKQSDLINFLTNPENKQTLIKYQKALADNWGYKGNIVGSPDAGFIPALTRAYDTFSQLPTAWQGGKVEDFILKPTISTGTTGGAGGAGAPTGSTTIYSKTSAKALINNVFDTLLKRKATDSEIKDFTKQLIDAQKANPSTSRTVNGIVQNTTGLNSDQFITDLVMALPEYKTKEAAKTQPELDKILATARNNGMVVSDSQKDAWNKRIKDGEDINTIASEIRSVSSYGYPESVKKLMASGTDLGTILSPYKNYMASTLELDPNTIDINDPTLRMAIGPQSEMNLYDYQKALRKDNRWQYTKNATETVNSAIDKLLQDFGFKG